MKKHLPSIAKFFASVFAIFFVFSLVSALFLYKFEKYAFDAETYKDALYEQDIYNRFPALMGEELVLSMGADPCVENPVSCDLEYRSDDLAICLVNALGSEAYLALSNDERSPTEAESARIAPCFESYGFPSTEMGDGGNPLDSLAKNLTAKDWEIFISALIPPEELENIAEESVDEIFEVLNGNADKVEISLVSLKARLASETGVNAVMTLIEAQPDCTPADLLKMSGFSGNQEIVFCKPPEMTLPLIKPMMETQLRLTASAIPDQKTLLKAEKFQSSLHEIQSVRALMRLSPILSIILLLLITILVVRSLRTWLRWWGVPFFFAGAIGAILSQLIPIFVRASISDSLGAETGVSESIIQLVYDLAENVVNNLMGNITVYALVFAGIGLIMAIASFFIKETDERVEVI